jgi:uncharacterized protein GlcG (DUF336 family)
MMKKVVFAVAMLLATGSGSWAQAPLLPPPEFCSLSQSVVGNVLGQLSSVVTQNNGGLFSPNRMWAAVVDRKGVLCAVTNSNPDAWPGSRAIAIAKANTANAFSNNLFALSTAMLYGPTQPGGSLYGLNNSNPFNPLFNAQDTGVRFADGGIITFGGGVALYSNGQVIGGLGVSGDTSCADHAIAFRMRKQATLNGTPNDDNISYYDGDPAHDNLITSSTQVDPSQFKQPHCLGASKDVSKP